MLTLIFDHGEVARWRLWYLFCVVTLLTRNRVWVRLAADALPADS